MKGFIIALLYGAFVFLFPNKAQGQRERGFDYVILSNDSLKYARILPLNYVNESLSPHEDFKILQAAYGINFNPFLWSFEIGLLRSSGIEWMDGCNFAFGEEYSEEIKIKTIKLSVCARNHGAVFFGVRYGGKFIIISNSAENVSYRQGFYVFLGGEVGYRISENTLGFGELYVYIRMEISDPAFSKRNFSPFVGFQSLFVLD